MQVEIWSDVVCPWCYIGKRRFEAALADFEHRDEVDVAWRSFQLDPSAPITVQGDPLDRLATKYGMSRADAERAQARVTANAAQEGLEFHLERARSGNTFDAHRLLHHALGAGRQSALKERLLAGYFTEGQAVGEPEVLARLATEIELDEPTVREVLATGAFAAEVRQDEQEARRLGISGVPFFVVDRAYGISGAQPPALILSTLEQAWSDSHPLTMVPVGGSEATCTDGDCAV